MLYYNVFAITEMSDMSQYEVSLSMSFFSFGMGSRAMRVKEGLCVLGAWCIVYQDLVSCYFYFVLLPLGPELWWVWCFILVFLCCSVNGSVCLVCCLFVNCLVKQFALCLGVVVFLLLNVMEVFSVSGGVLYFHRMCVVPVIPVCIKVILP